MTSSTLALSVQERRALDRLARQERLWPKQRWVVLSLSLTWIAVGIYVELGALHTLSETALAFSSSSSAVERNFNGSSVLLACLATKNATIGELLRWGGVFLLIWVLGRWRGNAVRKLLLALVARETEPNTDNIGPA